MATIHRASDEATGHEVAVKLLRPEISREPDLAQRFRREALAATVLRHPNIVACIDTGTDGDQPYLVMELVDGEDLAVRLRRSGRLAPWQAARIALDVARALAMAHMRGIVHRDIKPGNILLATDGRAMVTDFGIARLATEAEATIPGTTLGSVHYFSPEQARGLSTDPASDVYGLGLVLYECVTGRRAWSGDTTDAIALARVGAVAPSARAVAPDVPAALDAVIRRALSPESADRYPSGASMAAALEPIVAALERAPSAGPDDVASVTARSASTTVSPAFAVGSATGAASASGAPGARAFRLGARSRRTATPVALAALAIAGGLIGAVLVAAIPGAAVGLGPADRSPAGTAVASPGSGAGGSASPSDPAGAAAGPSGNPTATPTADPTATPAPTTRPRPATSAADLCESFFAIPCGLGAGTYAPSRFEPMFEIDLGPGWSSAMHEAGLVALTRETGAMTFSAGVTEVDPDGRAATPRDRARDIIEAFVVTDGLSSTKPAKVRIGGRRGWSVDLRVLSGRSMTLFRAGSVGYVLEGGRTTRLVAIDVRGRAAVLAIEPSAEHDLREILETADVAAGTIRWP
jgi:serine/threonine-protein kinase